MSKPRKSLINSCGQCTLSIYPTLRLDFLRSELTKVPC